MRIRVRIGFGKVQYLQGWVDDGTPILSDKPTELDSADSSYYRLWNRLANMCQTTFQITLED